MLETKQELIEKLEREMDKARRSISALIGVKGTPSELEYSRIYDRLALLGAGDRQRLREKYRG